MSKIKFIPRKKSLFPESILEEDFIRVDNPLSFKLQSEGELYIRGDKKEQLISFKTAKLAKEKGFDWECFFKYKHNKNQSIVKIYDNRNHRLKSTIPFFTGNYNNSKFTTSTPTQSLLQKWLREKYNIIVLVNIYCPDWDKTFNYYPEINIPSSGDFGDILEDKNLSFDTYEEALEKGLYEALKLIDNETS